MTRCRAGESWAACSLQLFAGVYIRDETCLLKAFNFALACARIFLLDVCTFKRHYLLFVSECSVESCHVSVKQMEYSV